MTDKEVEDEFLDECRNLFGIRGVTGVTLESRLDEDLGATSMIYMGLSGILDQLFGKATSYLEVKSCKTLADVLALGRG